ncbi:MAG TPA: hypothetical protein VJ499_02755 [Flavisolibacter sp.]|nr:hypothetical protein [Flavisolibacter sp.]
MARIAIVLLMLMVLKSSKSASQATFRGNMDTCDKKLSLKVLPPNFYTNHLSFFCKKELQVQKTTAIPVFIRLGSKEYVDRLERKPNSGYPGKQ